MNSMLKRILTAGAGLALAALMAVPAFAVTTPETPATKAEIDVTKIVTTDTEGVFPAANSYTFTLTPDSVVMGRSEGTQYYDGKTDAVNHPNNTMPMPGSATAGTALDLTVSGLATADDVDDTTTQRDRTMSFAPITFDNTGIYTYKLTEKIPTTKETGVTYDTTMYWVNIYVTNVLNNDGSNTPALDENGKLKTTISRITLFEGDTNKANIALQGKDFGDDNADTSEDDAKVDITSTPKTGDATTFAMDVPFTNSFDVEDLTVSKTVTGTLGDPDKEFNFTFTAGTNAPSGYSYTYKVFNKGADETDAGAVQSAGTFEAITDSHKNNDFTLKHNQYVKVYGLPVGLTYTVAESDADTYITTIAWQNGKKGETGESGTIGDGTATKTSTETRTIATTTLKDGESAGDRDNHAYFTNNKEATTPTGVLLRFAPFVLLAALLIAGIVLVVLNGKKRRDTYQGL